MTTHSTSTPSITLTRRKLLQNASLMTGALLVPGLAQAASAAPPGRLGILLPYSPQGDSFLAGLRLAMPGADLLLERVKPGRFTYTRATERLLRSGADRLIGLMSPNLAVAVKAQLEAAGVSLLAVDTGANLVRVAEESPFIHTHSLGHWRGAVALGAWSVGANGPRGLVLSGFQESGYDMRHAFEVGLTGAGGTALPAIVTHASSGPVDWDAVFARVREGRPDVVYALYSGDAAVEFLRAWQSSGLAIPLLSSPSLVDESLLPLHAGRAEGLVSASAWAPTLKNQANDVFVTAYTTAAGKAPDSFALLGYEAGILTVAGLQKVEGPRGWIRPGPAGATRYPLYRRKVVGLANQTVGALPALAEADAIVATLRGAVRTGWTEPYLA